jgi:hypothetical protein
MAYNNRVVTTTTSSVSFDKVMFEFMEQDRRELRLDRSQYLRELLEQRYQQKYHKSPLSPGAPEASSGARNGVPLFPKSPGARSASLDLVKRLLEDAP